MRLSQNAADDLSLFPRKRGRPKGASKKHVSVYVLPETAEILQAKSFKMGKSLGEVIDRLLAKFRTNKNKKPNEKEHISASQTSSQGSAPVVGVTSRSDEGKK